MIRYNKYNFILLIVFNCITGLLQAQENLMNYENSLKFARHLSASGQYIFASEEFEKLNFLWPNDSIVILELVENYRMGNQCEKLILSTGLLSTYNRIFKIPEYSREYLRFALNCRHTDPLYFKVASNLTPKEYAIYTTGYFWINGQYDSLFNNHVNDKLIEQYYPEMYKLKIEFENEKYKKPEIALFMSMVVPGSGKAYTKKWGDALISFLFVGTNAYASYRAFNKKGIKSTNGWIFGGLAVSFYSANLWGSFKSAKKYNNDLKINYQKNAEDIIYNNY